MRSTASSVVEDAVSLPYSQDLVWVLNGQPRRADQAAPPARGERARAPNLVGHDAYIIAIDGMYTARALDPPDSRSHRGTIDLGLTIRPDQAGELSNVIDQFNPHPTLLRAHGAHPGADARSPAPEAGVAGPRQPALILHSRGGEKRSSEMTTQHVPNLTHAARRRFGGGALLLAVGTLAFVIILYLVYYGFSWT